MTLRLTILCLASVGLTTVAAQTRPQPADGVDRAAAYFNYSMGHLYSELAGAYGNRGQYLNQAIDHYREALKADPAAKFITEDLADLYIQAGRLREAVSEYESVLKQNPADLNARRILGRIYVRMVGDTQSGRLNQTMLDKAIEQYLLVARGDPADTEAWMVLGRLYKLNQNSPEAESAFKKALEIEPENEEAMAGLAMVYSDLGDAKRASELLRKVAEKNPNLRTLTSLAGAYEQMRDYAMAAETLKKALEVAPESTELKRAMAQTLLMADRLDEARKVFEALVAEDPRDVQSMLRLSQIHRQQRRYAQAREWSDKAKKESPDNLEVLYNEVGIYEAQGQLAEAIQTLKSVLDQTAKRNYSSAERNNRAMLLERLGLLYRANEQFAEAIAAFEEFGQLDASLGARAAAQVADTYRQSKDLSKALGAADAGLKKWPEDRTLRVVRATVLADLGRSEEGAADIRKLLSGQDDRATYLTLAQIHEKGKNWAEMAKAIDAAEKLTEAGEDREAIHFMRGAMYEKMKKLEQSEAEFRKLLELNPNNASALNYLGYMFADRNVKLAEAVSMIQAALEQEPNNGAFLDSLGWAYYRMGKLEEAETYLLRALERAGKDPTIHDHLGDVYAKTGRIKDAIRHWELSLKLWGQSTPAEQDPQEVARIQKKLERAKVRLAKE